MRVHAVFEPADFRPTEDAPAEDSAAMFAAIFPGVSDPRFDGNHAGMAVAAVNPELALHMRALSAFMLTKMPFGQQADLREIVIQTVHRKLGCDYGFRSRLDAGKRAGLTAAMLAALPTPSAELFNEDQRLVIAYTIAVVENAVTDDLLARFSSRFGEKAAIECASMAGLWSCWSMIINVAQPHDPEAVSP